eukprot:gb/GFBE01003355.1/.p1 GENE.gb/GFBE01003355.1/~~gb/GFBE01003355.1/.p1  ORF type:complete len:117 (+),score=22.04 gb/GFBE01003355.1/:1-351(+)
MYMRSLVALLVCVAMATVSGQNADVQLESRSMQAWRRAADYRRQQSRELHEVNATELERLPLPPKRQYPVDAGAMIGGIIVGSLGVPILYGIWAFHEKNFKKDGGAFAFQNVADKE